MITTTSIESRKLIHAGSVKNVIDSGDNTLDFEFTDRWSAFDVGPHPQEIPGMGEMLCACSVKSFEIARMVNVPTHFGDWVDERTIRVKKLRVPESEKEITTSTFNYVVPLEWIFRFRVSGSLLRAFKSGSKKPRDYGFPTDETPSEGAPLPWPVHEFTTKREPIDRPLTTEEAARIGGLTLQEVERIWSMIDMLNGAINLELCNVGFARLDGKVEIGLGPHREPMLVDTFGTFHEDRFADPSLAFAFSGGSVRHYSKEYLRQILIGKGYKAALDKARSSGEEDPPYPSLSNEEILEARARFKTFTESYTGTA